MISIKHFISTLAVTITLCAPSTAPAQSPAATPAIISSKNLTLDTHEIDSALAHDTQGTVLAIFRRADEIGDYRYVGISRSTDSGNSWSVIREFPQPIGSAADASITFAGNQTFVALWINEQSAGQVKVYTSRSTDNGNTWSEPTAVPVTDPSTHLDMASNAAGTIVASFSGLRLTSLDYGQTWAESSPAVDGFIVGWITRNPAPITYSDGQFLQAYGCVAQSPICIMPGSIDCYFP